MTRPAAPTLWRMAWHLGEAERNLIAVRFTTVDGILCLAEPVRPVVLPPAPPARAALHPVRRAYEAGQDQLLKVAPVDKPLASPLARVGVFANYCAFGWTPDAYEYAIERAGVLLDSGYSRADADRRAVTAARIATTPPRQCGTCAFYRVLSRARSTHGACALVDTAVVADDATEEPCGGQYQPGITDALYHAILTLEARTAIAV